MGDVLVDLGEHSKKLSESNISTIPAKLTRRAKLVRLLRYWRWRIKNGHR